jgi:hypothetical protein
VDNNTSGWAVGWTFFAAFMMILLGVWHAIAGLSAILNDTFYTPGERLADGYFLKLDVSTWGWIHLIVGIVILFAGTALFTGAVWARTIGVILAALSGIAAFSWLPYYPVWAILLIAAAIAVVWALTTHGRDVIIESGYS